jgi:magnesium chelatase family protein
MALATLSSRGQHGLGAYAVTVEVHLAGGLPGFTITGMPATAVRESRERVRAALQGNGLSWPARRITAHLGPADVPKDGGRFDLPIALGVVQAETGREWRTRDLEFIGELALSGALRPVTGALPAVLAARDAGRTLILPDDNAAEASLVPDAKVYRAAHLMDVIRHLDGGTRLARVSAASPDAPEQQQDAASNGRTGEPLQGTPHGVPASTAALPDLGDVIGQETAKRALEIAAAGGHNMLMMGPPGSGKSMLAERLPGLLPPLGVDDMLCVASIASVAGLAELIGRRTAPFRAPHHTASANALVGGGNRPRPGEISLAHKGVLFLDELPEFSRHALEALREPMETGVVRIARVQRSVSFPAEFQLLAAMNPCPCGYLGDGTDRCRCPEERVRSYRGRLSGPLLDRVDLHIEVPRSVWRGNGDSGAADAGGGHSETAQVRERVLFARQRQRARGHGLNARLNDAELKRVTQPDGETRRLLEYAAERWHLSARAINRVLKVGRTIADLAGAAAVSRDHVAEALQLRCLDRPP